MSICSPCPGPISRRPPPGSSRVDVSARLAVTTGPTRTADEATRDTIDAVLRFAGTKVAIFSAGNSDGLASALKSLAPAAALLSHEVEELEIPAPPSAWRSLVKR